MSKLREAAQQALEALMDDCLVKVGPHSWERRSDLAITALRAALAEHDKKIVWVEERKAHWAEQLQLARETQERERQQREEAALAEPVQEPVAWRWGYRSVTTGEMDWRGYVEIAADPNLRSPAIIMQPLYTAPPQRKPLTDEKVCDLWSWSMTAEAERTATTQQHAFARAIEKAHGIGVEE